MNMKYNYGILTTRKEFSRLIYIVAMDTAGLGASSVLYIVFWIFLYHIVKF